MKARPEAERAAALELLQEHGLAETHRRTGIPKQTLRNWGGPGIGAHQCEQTRAATAVNVATMAERRGHLSRVLLEIAEDRAETIRTHQAKDAVTEVKLMTVAAIAIDKSQLLAGEATNRIETIAPEAVEAIDNVLELRRAS